MMELRKCCNHPYLFPGAEEAYLASGGGGGQPLDALVAASGKLALVDQMVCRLREDGHRILIYSQFTTVREASLAILDQHSLRMPVIVLYVSSRQRALSLDLMLLPGVRHARGLATGPQVGVPAN